MLLTSIRLTDHLVVLDGNEDWNAHLRIPVARDHPNRFDLISETDSV